MFRQPPRKAQQKFPHSEGWVKVENKGDSPLHVMIEPWALGHDLAPGENCYVRLTPDGDQPLLRLSAGLIVAFCGDAIYQDGREVLDFRD